MSEANEAWNRHAALGSATLRPPSHPSQVKSSRVSSPQRSTIDDMLRWIINSITYKTQPKVTLLSLPQELLVQIAREAHSLHDVRALLLTCRRFARICRHLIFQQDIEHGYGVSMLYAALNNEPDLAVRAILAGMDINATIPPTNAINTHLRYLAEVHGCPRSLAPWTILQLSAYCNSKDVTRILIDNGAHMDAGLDFLGRSALHLSIYNGAIETSRLLIERGADILAPDSQGVLPLHYAAITDGATELTRLLVRAGVPIDVETTGTRPKTPLYMAIQYNCESSVLWLLQNGANAASGITSDWDALLFAARSSTENVANWIFQFVDKLEQIHDYAKFLEIVCSKGWSDLVCFIVRIAKNRGIVGDTINKYGNPLTFIQEYARCISTKPVLPQSRSDIRRDLRTTDEVSMGGYQALFTLVPDSNEDIVAVIEILLQEDQTAAARKFYSSRNWDLEDTAEGSPLAFALTNGKKKVVAFMQDVLATWTEEEDKPRLRSLEEQFERWSSDEEARSEVSWQY